MDECNKNCDCKDCYAYDLWVKQVIDNYCNPCELCDMDSSFPIKYGQCAWKIDWINRVTKSYV